MPANKRIEGMAHTYTPPLIKGEGDAGGESLDALILI